MGTAASSEKARSYDSIIPKLRTGDIGLTSGRGCISDMIKCGTWSNWSHVFMVVRTNKKFKCGSDKDGLYMLHSYVEPLGETANNCESVTKKGVQLNSLREAISRYDGTVYIRLKPPHISDVDPFDSEKWNAWYKKAITCDYQRDYQDLVFAEMGSPCCPMFQNYGDDSSLFCSELIPIALQKAFPQEFSAASFDYGDQHTPKDLSSDWTNYCCENKIDVSAWGKEIKIKKPPRRRQ